MSTEVAKRKTVSVGLSELTQHNIENLKKLVGLCFPIQYEDDFYEKCHLNYNELSRFATVKDIIVGAVSCRLEKEEDSDKFFVHIMILLTYEKYRRLGIAHQLMQFVYKVVSNASFPVEYYDLHVQKVNQSAVNFYLKEGFEVVEELKDYYDIENGDALHMRKKVERDPNAPPLAAPSALQKTITEKHKKGKAKGAKKIEQKAAEEEAAN